MTLKPTASLLLLAATAQAQGTFSVGPRVGLNLATVNRKSSPEDVSRSYRPGVEVGAVGSLHFGRFALQPALLYSQKGFKYRSRIDYRDANGFGTADLDENIRLDYLTLPISLAYCQRENGQGFQVFAGPYLGLLLGGQLQNTIKYPTKSETYSGKILVTNDERTGYGSAFRRYDAGLQAGLGYRHQELLFQVNYSMGFRAITLGPSDSGGWSSPDYDNYTRAFQASVSYLFSPKGE